jgi:hypothetical protein
MPSTKTVKSDTDFDELSAAADERGIYEAFSRLLSNRSSDAQTLGSLHQRLLDRSLGRRKRTGTYYTPPELVSLLLDHALEPILAAKASSAVGSPIRSPKDLKRLVTSKKKTAVEALLSTTILDPACGSGVFLEAAKQRLVCWLQPLRFDAADLSTEQSSRCLFGIDLDETAALLARHATGGNIHVGDALFESPPWSVKSFDAVVGNPPFANAIEGLVSDATKKRLAERWPELRGTADLAYYFLAAAHEFACELGSVGLVLPRSILSAPAARKLRERLHAERPPAFLHASNDPLHFVGANVYVALVVLRNAESLAVDPDNWWRGLAALESSSRSSSGPTLGDAFEVASSMTTGEAYELRPFVIEGDERSELRFITTGLIDPGVCLWGDKPCRYLGSRFLHPIIEVSSLPEKLRYRIERLRRPKLLVAGLSTRVEAFLDATANHVGAVSTYSIMHPDDDVTALANLCDSLNSDDAAHQLREELGATALGGGRITLTKAFLKGLRIGDLRRTPKG